MRPATCSLTVWFVVGVVTGGPATADLIGDDVRIEQNSTSLGTIRDDIVIVVEGSPEVACPGPYELCGASIPGLTHGNFDIESLSLTLNVGPDGSPGIFVSQAFAGYIFSDLDLPSGVTSAVIETDITGLDNSRVVIFSASSVGVNLSELTVSPGEFFTVHLNQTVWSQEYAFAWANDPTAPAYTPLGLYSYNHLGGNIQITRTGTGAYSVQFASFGAFGTGGNVQVTAYGSFSGAGQYCKVQSWSSDTANVRCFNAAGALSDSYFTVLYLKTPSLPSSVAYAWANNATSASYTPNSLFSYNPTGGAITATRNGTGDYSMTWSGFSTLAAGGGHPQVTAYDASNKRCQVLGWFGDLVNVRCYDSAGNPADSLYSVLVVRPAATDDGLAFAWANEASSASYTPSLFNSFNFGGEAISATRTGTGTYRMTFSGFSERGIDGGHVHVTGFSAFDRRCAVSSWGSEHVDVLCHNAAGAAVDTPYNVMFIKPVAIPEPSSVAMLASGVALILLLTRARAKRERRSVHSPATLTH